MRDTRHDVSCFLHFAFVVRPECQNLRDRPDRDDDAPEVATRHESTRGRGARVEGAYLAREPPAEHDVDVVDADASQEAGACGVCDPTVKCLGIAIDAK